MSRAPRFYLPVLIYTGLILIASSLSQDMVVRYAPTLQDYVLHFIEYNIYGVCWLWFFLADQPLDALKRAYRSTILAGTSIAILDEIYQSFIPSRVSSIQDVAADTLGIICSVLTFWLIMRIPYVRNLRQVA